MIPFLDLSAAFGTNWSFWNYFHWLPWMPSLGLSPLVGLFSFSLSPLNVGESRTPPQLVGCLSFYFHTQSLGLLSFYQLVVWTSITGAPKFPSAAWTSRLGSPTFHPVSPILVVSISKLTRPIQNSQFYRPGLSSQLLRLKTLEVTLDLVLPLIPYSEPFQQNLCFLLSNISSICMFLTVPPLAAWTRLLPLPGLTGTASHSPSASVSVILFSTHQPLSL